MFAKFSLLFECIGICLLWIDLPGLMSRASPFPLWEILNLVIEYYEVRA